MAPHRFGGRLRRATLLTLFVCVLEGWPALVAAQEMSRTQSFSNNAAAPNGGSINAGAAPNNRGASFENSAPGDGSFEGPNREFNEYGPSGENYGVCEQPARRGLPVWFGAEWIHWRLDGGDKLPPLVTAGPSSLPPDQAGFLNDPNTVILSGDDTVNDDWRDGFRVFAGVWCDCCRTHGVEFDYFDVGDDDYNFTSGNDPNQVVGRPFFNTETGQDDLELVSVPGELEGTAHVNSSDTFRGAGLACTRCLCRCCDPCCGTGHEVSALAGYRFYEYDSELTITENLTVLPGTQTPLVPGTTIFVQDQFRTHNEFNGFELGIQGMMKSNCWWVDGLAKVAVGVHRRTVTIDGQTVTDVPGGGSTTEAGGLLTSSVTNIGHYEDTDFAVIPEFRLGVGRQLTSYCAVRAGYNLIFWDKVVRAGDTLPPDLRVDPRNLPPVQPGGGTDPAFPGFHGSELFAHGLDVSVMFEF